MPRLLCRLDAPPHTNLWVCLCALQHPDVSQLLQALPLQTLCTADTGAMCMRAAAARSLSACTDWAACGMQAGIHRTIMQR